MVWRRAPRIVAVALALLAALAAGIERSSAIVATAQEDQPPICVPPAPIQARVLDTITLTAPCEDPERLRLTFVWSVVQRPPGSTTTLSDPTQPQVSLFLDVPTTPETPYVVEVVATDVAGQSDRTRFTIFASTSDRLSIQLVWDTDQTDLDLHLLDDIGTADRFGSSGWFNTVKDCYYLNRNPDWGVAGNSQDNPRLDIDDISGFGPETINMSEPFSGTYAVGVHYFCDKRLGATRATVRIFCDGALTREFARELSGTGEFWEVATVTFPGCSVQELNAVATVPQGCQAPPADTSPPVWPPGSSLAATPGSTSVILAWTPAIDDVGVTAYQIFVDGVLFASPAAGRLSFDVGPLEAGRTYTFKVEACDAAGNCSRDGPQATATPIGGDGGLFCEILTPPAVLREGATLTFTAVAKNTNGALIPGASFAWNSDAPASVAVDDNGLATGGSNAGVAHITCRVVGGSSTPSAPVAVRNYNRVDPGIVRAVVIDERTGAPLPGAIVLFEPTGVLQPTDENGVAQLQAEGPINLHVFKTQYTWISIIGTTANDILVPLNPAPDETRAGGFQGTFDFSLVPNSTDTVGFGLAGASIAGSFIDLDFSKLIGAPYRYRVTIGDLFDDFISLPSGLALTIGDVPVKGNYQAVASAGLRHAWGIGGKIPFDQLIRVLTPLLGGGAIPFGQVISQLIPFFERFQHFVRPDTLVSEVPTIRDAGDINGNGSTTDLIPDFQNAIGFPTVIARPSEPLSLSPSVVVPPLPPSHTDPIGGVFVLAGANVTGRGLVPLGLGAADAPGTLAFKISPPHGGLEGSKFVFATLATTTTLSGRSRVSGIITHADHLEQTPIPLPNFLGFPETAAYDPATRTFRLGQAVSGAGLYRADFEGLEGDWVVYFAPPMMADAPAFVLPALPIFIDRAGFGSALRLVSVATKPCLGSAAPDLNALSRFGTINLTTLNDCLSAFSSATVRALAPPPPPHALRVVKTVEDLNGAPVRAGDELRYTVQVSNEGAVELTGVTITDPLPAAHVGPDRVVLLLDFVSASNGCAFDGSRITCPIGVLGPLRTVQVEFTGRLLDRLVGPVSNQAIVTANEFTSAVLSDDPTTTAFGDPTIVNVSAPPVLPPSTPDLPDEFDTGASRTDNLTNIPAPRFVGTAEPDVEVQLFVDGQPADRTRADSVGMWAITLTAPLRDGPHQITAKAINAAGDTSFPSMPLVITIDTTPPDLVCPVPLTILQDAAGLAEAPDFQLDITRQEPVTVTQDPRSGTPLAAGIYDVAIAAADTAGNTSTCTAALTVLESTPPAPVQPTVVQRGRLGNLTRDVTFVRTGPFASHIAILDGYEVLGVAAAGSGQSAVHNLFDVRGLALEHGPEGLAYIESEQLFAMVDPLEPTKLFVSDHLGQPHGVRTIQYLNGVPDFVNGLAYIPAASPVFADHLVVVFTRFGETSASGLAIVRRDGTVVAELLPRPVGGTPVEFVGVAYAAPDRLLVSTSGNEIWTLDFAGNVIAGPVAGPERDIEGLVQLPDQRIAAVNRTGGTLLFLDESLRKLSSQDRSYALGVGVSQLTGLAWDSDDERHLVSHLEPVPENFSFQTVVTSIPYSLDAAQRILEETGSNAGGFLSTQATTYLADEDLIALGVASGRGPSVLLYDHSGLFVDSVSVPAFQSVFGVRDHRQPGPIDYIPTTREFALTVQQESRRVHFVSRTGTLTRTIDFSGAGIDQIRAIVYFNPDHPSGGQLLVVDSEATDRALITDFNGHPLAEFNYRASLNLLGVRDGAAITTGPQAGTFSVIDPGNSELVVFGLGESR